MLLRFFTAPTVRRRFFSVAASPPRREQVVVPCRSHGFINIDIFHASTPSSPILIYLPSGPVIPGHSEDEDRVITALAASSRSTVARINYRFSEDHCWPTPLHDVLHGYDWIFQHLLHSQPPLAKLGVCGELAGGSLATTLALTECQVGQSRIVAAAVNNPIADWIFPDDLPVPEKETLPEPHSPEETSMPADHDMMTWWAQKELEEQEEKAAKPKRKATPPKPTAWVANSDNPIIPTLCLSGERDMLFSNPEHLFDRFASPIHFFRSPHGMFIKPQSDDIYASSPPPGMNPQDPLDWESQMALNHFSALNEKEKPPEIPTLVRCRSYARVHPPAGSALALPQFHITSGSASPLLGQAEELTKFLRRSIARQALRGKTARGMWQDKDEKEKYERWAKERVRFEQVEGIGLWTVSEDVKWEDRVEGVGEWMGKSLREKGSKAG